MQKDFQNLLSGNGEILIDSLIENEILREIPILSSSLNLIRGINSLRDKAYLNKIKLFIDNLGQFTEEKRNRLIEESRRDQKRRSKFGDALFTAIERSDSTIKVEYLSTIFEAFLRNDFDNNTLRLLCHIIQISFSDDLENIIENMYPKIGHHHVPSGLAQEMHSPIQMGGTTEPQYRLSKEAQILRTSWENYKTIK